METGIQRSETDESRHGPSSRLLFLSTTELTKEQAKDVQEVRAS